MGEWPYRRVGEGGPFVVVARTQELTSRGLR
jgi:hypothetical protein